MRKALTLVLVVALVGLFCGTASAREEGKFGLGLKAGASMFAGDSVVVQDPAGDIIIDIDMDTSFNFGGTATYWFADMFSLELAVEWGKTELTAKVPGVIEEKWGDVTQIPIMLTARFHPFDFDSIEPYVGVGAGYYINDFSAKDPEDKTTVDNNAGFHAALGAEWFVTEQTGLCLDLRYQFDQAKFKDEGFSQNLDMNAFTIQAGFKYYW